eukprot:TRINITY_DN918_c0_g1_i1.p1 TRINITY_DN918_c0_g1~~TRINITY_DN918_c0_g1_i1.p1  ORF type:complete len:833 (+),score=218.09 TRINITY_DN918_c0_g1_i1:79-2499(+)
MAGGAGARGDYRTMPGRESRVARIIRDARATLNDPSRPETPRDELRGFYQKGLSSRQGTPVSLQPLVRGWRAEHTAAGAAAAAEQQQGDGTDRDGTPAVSKAAAARASAGQRFAEGPERGAAAAAGQLPFPSGDAEEDPLWQEVRNLYPRLEPDPSGSTAGLREVIGRVADCILQLANAAARGALARDSRARALLGRLQRLEDVSDPVVLLRYSRIVLACSPGGPFLVGTMSVLYRLSKQGGNDTLFRQERLLDPLVRVLEDGDGSVGLDALTLAAGALKNISDSAENQRVLATSCGAVGALAQLCQAQIAALAAQEAGAAPRQRVDLLIQATSTLRNLSQGHGALFAKLGAIDALYPAVFSSLRGYRDVVLNAARIISKLSQQEECRACMNREPANLAHLVEALGVYQDQRTIVVRIAFALGNLVQTNEVNRQWIGVRLPGCLDAVLAVFQRHCTNDIAIGDKLQAAQGSEWPPELDDDGAGSNSPGSKKGRPVQLSSELVCPDGTTSPGSEAEKAQKTLKRLRKEQRDSDDSLVKLVRVVANLAICPEVGPRIAADAGTVDGVIGLLQRKAVTESEELVLNAVCCATNLSFYIPGPGDPSNIVAERQQDVGEAIAMLLMHDHVDAVVESARAFGNFSRSREMRQWMVEHRVDEACAILVDHSDRRVVYAVCGVLLNFSADPDHWQIFERHELLEKLAELAGIVELSDLELLALVYKLYYNLADKGIFAGAEAARIGSEASKLLAEAEAQQGAAPSVAFEEFRGVCSNVVLLLGKCAAEEHSPGRGGCGRGWSEFEQLPAPEDGG